MDRVYDDCGKTECEEILNPGTPTTDVVYSCPVRGGSRTTLEAHDDGVVLLALGPGASSASTQLITSTLPPAPATGSNVPYTDWTTAHGAHLPSGAPVAPSQSIVGTYAYPDVVMAMEHSGSVPAPAATRSSVLSTGPVTGESYTDMLMAHLSSSGDMSTAAAWNNMAYAGSVTPSAAINGVATTAYPGGPLNLNAAVTPGPDTNVVGFGYAIDVHQGMADLASSERLHPTGTAAAATESLGGCYYYNNSGMALPFAAQVVNEADMEGLVAHAAVSLQDEVAGAVAEPVRGGLGGIGLAATSLAMAGLIAGGEGTPVTAIALFGMLIAGVILVTVRVLRA